MTQEKKTKVINSIIKSDTSLNRQDKKTGSLTVPESKTTNYLKPVYSVIHSVNKNIVSSAINNIGSLAKTGLINGSALSISMLKGLVFKTNYKEREFKYLSYIRTYEEFVNTIDSTNDGYNRAKVAHDALRAFQKENDKHINYDPKTYEYRLRHLHETLENPSAKKNWIEITVGLNYRLRLADENWDELNLRRKLKL